MIQRRAPQPQGLHLHCSPAGPGSPGPSSHRCRRKIPGSQTKFQDFRRRALKAQHILIENVQVCCHQANIPVKLVGRINSLFPRQIMEPPPRGPFPEDWQTPVHQSTLKFGDDAMEHQTFQTAECSMKSDMWYDGKYSHHRNSSELKAIVHEFNRQRGTGPGNPWRSQLAGQSGHRRKLRRTKSASGATDQMGEIQAEREEHQWSRKVGPTGTGETATTDTSGESLGIGEISSDGGSPVAFGSPNGNHPGRSVDKSNVERGRGAVRSRTGLRTDEAIETQRGGKQRKFRF